MDENEVLDTEEEVVDETTPEEIGETIETPEVEETIEETPEETTQEETTETVEETNGTTTGSNTEPTPFDTSWLLEGFETSSKEETNDIPDDNKNPDDNTTLPGDDNKNPDDNTTLPPDEPPEDPSITELDQAAAEAEQVETELGMALDEATKDYRELNQEINKTFGEMDELNQGIQSNRDRIEEIAKESEKIDSEMKELQRQQDEAQKSGDKGAILATGKQIMELDTRQEELLQEAKGLNNKIQEDNKKLQGLNSKLQEQQERNPGALAAYESAKYAWEQAHQATLEAKSKVDEKASEQNAKAQEAAAQAQLVRDAQEAEQRAIEEAAAKQQQQQQQNQTKEDPNAGTQETSETKTEEKEAPTGMTSLIKDPSKVPKETLDALKRFDEENPEFAKFVAGQMKGGIEGKAFNDVLEAINDWQEGNKTQAIMKMAKATGESLLSIMNKLKEGVPGIAMDLVRGFKDLWAYMKSKGKGGERMDIWEGGEEFYDEIKAIAEDFEPKDFDYMKDTGATDVSQYNRGMGTEVNEVVSDACKKVFRSSPYVHKAVKKWQSNK